MLKVRVDLELGLRLVARGSWGLLGQKGSGEKGWGEKARMEKVWTKKARARKNWGEKARSKRLPDGKGSDEQNYL